MNKMINNRRKTIHGCGLGLCLWAASMASCFAVTIHNPKWSELKLEHASTASGWTLQTTLSASFSSDRLLGPNGADYNYKYSLLALRGSNNQIITCDQPDPNVSLKNGSYAYHIGANLWVVPTITGYFKRDELCDLQHQSHSCLPNQPLTHNLQISYEPSKTASISLNEDLLPRVRDNWNIVAGSYAAPTDNPFCPNFTGKNDAIGTIKSLWRGNVDRSPAYNSIHVTLAVYSDGPVTEQKTLSGFNGLSLQVMSSDPNKSEIFPLLSSNLSVLVKHHGCVIDPDTVSGNFGIHNVNDSVDIGGNTQHAMLFTVHCDHNDDATAGHNVDIYGRLYRNPPLPSGSEIKNELYVPDPKAPAGQGEKTLYYQAIMKQVTSSSGNEYPNCQPDSSQPGLVDFKQQAEDPNKYIHLLTTSEGTAQYNWPKFGIFWSLCGKSSVKGFKRTTVTLDVFSS